MKKLISILLVSLATVTATAATFWPATATPAVNDNGPDASVELGVKFQSDVAGVITGIRFYKAPANLGTHSGTLWTAAGSKLATATFANESASGWQQVNFATPVTIKAKTTYVASYHASKGHWSVNWHFFSDNGVDASPLRVLRDGVSGGNGVYRYSASNLFPNKTWIAANYWVDVVFQTGTIPTLSQIVVTPAKPSLKVGAAQQFTATGVYSDGSLKNVTSQAVWISSSGGVATIVNTSGVATTVAAGSTTITASLAGQSGNTLLTVQPVVSGVGKVTLGWDAGSGIHHYLIRQSEEGGPFLLVGGPVLGTSVVVSNLKALKSYRFHALAVDAAGIESGPSNVVSFLVPAGN